MSCPTVFSGSGQTCQKGRAIKCAPLFKTGRLLGIIRLANLVRALTATGDRLTMDAAMGDRNDQNVLADPKDEGWIHV